MFRKSQIGRILACGAVALAAALAAPGTSAAQSDFSTVITVNGVPISAWELDQRVRFLTVLRAPGDIPAEAQKSLIEDRLRLVEARRLGLEATEEEIAAGMTEFAARANLSSEEFVAALNEAGIDYETFRDFVIAGVSWRKVVSERFRGTFTVSQAEVERAIAPESGRGSGARVLVSEIVIPAEGGDMLSARREATLIATELGEGRLSFAEAARRHSGSPSRENGGALGWMPATNLPPGVRAQLSGLGPGAITQPVAVPGGVAIFQIRGLDAEGTDKPTGIRVEYARLSLSGPDDVARLAARVRTCDDLHTFARAEGLPRVVQQTVPESALPRDIAGTIAALDVNEGTAIGGGTQFVMVCERSATVAAGAEPYEPAPDARYTVYPEGVDPDSVVPRMTDDLTFAFGPSSDTVISEITNRRLGGLAEAYMAELVADAVIIRAK